MRGTLAAPRDAARQAEYDEVPRESRLHRWVSRVLPQDPRPAAPANTTRVTGALARLVGKVVHAASTKDLAARLSSQVFSAGRLAALTSSSRSLCPPAQEMGKSAAE